jgi:polysaccharide pyruvyl transferase WcaK-like protein
LVLGNYGAGNTGDEAVLAGLAEWIALDADLTILSRNPTAVTGSHGVRAAPMTPFHALRAVIRTDVVAVGGGGMFGKGLPRLVTILPGVLLAVRHVLRKRVVLMSLGVYPDTPMLTLRLLQLAARSADAVHLRDERSVATMRSGRLGRRVPAVLVGDPAVYLTPESRADAQRLLARYGVGHDARPLILSVKPTPDLAANDRVVSMLAQVTSWWSCHHDDPVVIVPLSVQGDYGLGPAHRDEILGERIRSAATHPERIVVLPAGLRPREAKAVFGQASAVIGMRFHALVFSVCMQRPTLGLVFEHKAAAWMDQVGGDQLPVDRADADALICWLRDLQNQARTPPPDPALSEPVRPVLDDGCTSPKESTHARSQDAPHLQSPNGIRPE